MLQNLNNFIQFKPIQPLIFLVNKPIGLSSFAIVDLFKKILNDKVGHAGTLDPLATGELLLLTGHTTKLSEKFINKNKQYSTTFLLGLHTNSYDLETPFLKPTKTKLPYITKDKLTFVLNNLKNEQPIRISGYSAIKLNGKPLYISNKYVYKRMAVLNYKIISIQTVNTQYITQKISHTISKIQKNKLIYCKVSKIYKISPKRQQINLFNNLISKLEHNKKILRLYKNYKLYILKLLLTVTKGTYIRSIAQQIEQNLNIPTTTLRIHRINTYD